MLVKARIALKKPDIGDLSKKGYSAVDMHFHTIYSDSFSKIPNVLKKADKLGIGLSITDHNEIRGCLEAYKRKDDQLIIPGIELTSLERCHMLLYFYKISELKEFYDENIRDYKGKNPYYIMKVKTSQIIKAARDYDSVICAAHPFSIGFSGMYKCMRRKYVHPSTINDIDCIEIMNGAVTKKMNWKAIEWADKLSKAYTGGSDGHTLYEMGKIVTYSKAYTVKGFLDAIKERENYVVGKQMGIIAHLPAHSMMFRKHLPYLRPTLKLRYYSSLKPSLKYHIPLLRRKLHNVKENGIAKVKDFAHRGIDRIDSSIERIRR